MLQLRPVIAGPLWGVLESIILIWAFWFAGYGDYNYYLTIRASALCLVIGVSVIIGYLTEEPDDIVKALLISIPIIFVLTLEILSLPALNLPALFVFVFSAGVLPLHLLFGAIAAFVGLSLKERLAENEALPVNSQVFTVCLLADGAAVFWPISPTVTDSTGAWSIPLTGDNWGVSIIAILVLIGLAGTVFGSIREGSMSSDLAGLFVITSALLGVLTAISISYSYLIYQLSASFPFPFYSIQAENFLHITWILGLSLLTPAIILLSCLFPRRMASLRQRLSRRKT
jgi:hypothetical protein